MRRLELLGFTEDGHAVVRREAGNVIIVNATREQLVALARKGKVRYIRASRIGMDELTAGTVGVLI